MIVNSAAPNKGVSWLIWCLENEILPTGQQVCIAYVAHKRMFIVELIHSHFHQTPKVINLCHEMAPRDLLHTLFCGNMYSVGDFERENCDWGGGGKLRNMY